MNRLLEAVDALVETWSEFRSWQADWNRTWSPVSYFLAIAMLVALLILAYVYGRDVWDYLTTRLWG